MDERVALGLASGECALAGILLWILPRIGRRGLLFGVYVGERAAAQEEARRILRSWDRRVLGTLSWGLAAGLLAGIRFQSLAAPPVALGVLLVGVLGAYLGAHRQAGRLAAKASWAAAAPLVPESGRSLMLPVLATAIAAVCGLFSVAFGTFHLDALPARIPAHFDAAGRPDAWAPKSFFAVMALPLLTLVVAPMTGLLACLTARAKRALRYPDDGASLAAQERFRRAVTRFLSGATILVAVMLAVMSVSSVRVALGRAAAMPPIVPALAVFLGAYALLGCLNLAIRHGQGGSRHEAAPVEAPLTNGLADNRRWRLGVFYVNPEDPSLLVEKRFGLGYTLNLGNWKAVALLFGFLFLVLGIALAAVLSTV